MNRSAKWMATEYGYTLSTMMPSVRMSVMKKSAANQLVAITCPRSRLFVQVDPTVFINTSRLVITYRFETHSFDTQTNRRSAIGGRHARTTGKAPSRG